MQQGLTTVVDATLLDDAARSPLVEHNRPVLVLILDPPLEVLLRRNKTRSFKVPESVVCFMHEKLQRTSR